MSKLQDWAALIFIGATAVLSCVSILGVWEVFTQDSIVKSFETFGLLAFACNLIKGVGAFIEARSPDGQPTPVNNLFKDIRKITVIILTAGVTILAFFGVLAIWEVLASTDIFSKVVTSLIILAFSGFIVLLTCFSREHTIVAHEGKTKHPVLIGLVVFFVLFVVVGMIGQFIQLASSIRG